MLKHYILFGLVLISNLSLSQNLNRKELGVPFDFPLYLSGNFGELRSNHFHAGLDFKTQNQSGKKMLALADGYISRVQVTHGSGYVLHTVYNNGITTVSRHLIGFVGSISQLVDSIQYATESWEMDYKFAPNEHLIRKGQHIAWSGNMGYSFGPHLHLELIDTETGDLIDGMPYYKKHLKDTKPPRADSYLLIPYQNEGIIAGSAEMMRYDITNPSLVSAWGKVSVGIKAFDYMDGTQNKYGVRNMKFYVDDNLIFESDVDKFSSSESRLINSWTYKNYMKTYIAPNNSLRMLTAHNDDKGWIRINEERDYLLKYVLTDYFGNQSTYKLTLRGVEQRIPQKEIEPRHRLLWNKSTLFSGLGISLEIPSGALYEDDHLDFKIHQKEDYGISYIYQLAKEDHYIPLHRSAKLHIGVLDTTKVDLSKLYIASLTSKGSWSSEGGTYKDGFVTANIRELGTYTVLQDTIAPQVKTIDKQKWASQGEIQFRVEDKETGISSYHGTIDGKYALFYLDIMPKKIRYKLDKTRLKRGMKHKVKLEVEDRYKNRTFIEEEFYW